jgi:hypothetical protein
VLQTTRTRSTAPLDDSPEQILESTKKQLLFAWDGHKYVNAPNGPTR